MDKIKRYRGCLVGLATGDALGTTVEFSPLGADFVLLGRPFVCALAALDKKGGDHVMNILKAELRRAMEQMGCPTLEMLPQLLIREES